MGVHHQLKSLGRALTVTGAIMLSTAFYASGVVAQTMGGDVIVVQGSNPPSLDAMSTSSQASRNINMNIYEPPIPILAETYEMSDDGMTYRFPLRKGVKFHNGKEMTAKDVKASLERYRKVGATGDLLDQVESIDITGDYEVTFTMKSGSTTTAPTRDQQVSTGSVVTRPLISTRSLSASSPNRAPKSRRLKQVRFICLSRFRCRPRAAWKEMPIS